MPNRHPLPLAAAALLVFAAAAAAQTPPAAGIEPAPSGFRADYLRELARLEERTLALAAEIPASRWAESPGPEVHPVGECFATLAAHSRRILVGMERPVPDALADTQSPADKAPTVEYLTAVLAAARRAVEETPDGGLEAPIDYLGRRWTVRALFLLLLAQTHEGLGHAAALAEVIGVPPPWVKHRRASEATGDD